MRWMRRWCWACAAVTWGLALMATAAHAAFGPAQAGVDWKTLAVGAIGFVSILVGVYARSLERRVDLAEKGVDEQERRLSDLIVNLARDHFTKAEINATYSELKNSISALHRRLDTLDVQKVHFQRSHATDGDPS